MSGAVEAARALMGPGVVVVGGRVADLAFPLWPGEEAAVARAVPRRREEFAAGRACARAGLRLLGLPAVALPRDGSGAPAWPPGVAGSISHGGEQVLAALARVGQAAAVGIDVEPLARLTPEVAAEVCRDGEDAGRALHVFGAKEAAYKALSALGAGLMGFADLRVTLVPRGFEAELRVAAGPFRPGLRLAGGQAEAAGLLVSAVRVAPAQVALALRVPDRGAALSRRSPWAPSPPCLT